MTRGAASHLDPLFSPMFSKITVPEASPPQRDQIPDNSNAVIKRRWGRRLPESAVMGVLQSLTQRGIPWDTERENVGQ